MLNPSNVLPNPIQIGRNLTAREFRGTALRVSTVVGSVLFLINHGSAAMDRDMNRSRWLSAGLTYLVPYCVSIHGQCSGRKRECKL